MKFTLSWLKEYVEFDLSPEDLAERLTNAGLEMESAENKGKGLENIIVAEILSMRPHPNAEKLTLCDVTDGVKRYNIVCGAKNMKAGDKVALAWAGTKLPPGIKFPEGIVIKSAKIRGEVSEGMLCSENELGIGDEGEGILILSDSAEVGGRLIDTLGLNDVVFEIAITPNRPDCLSVVGVAREVAAILGTRVKYPEFGVIEEGKGIENLASVEVRDPNGCPRYSCRVITDVKIADSPDWLKKRLEACGVRSINNVVDVTNFVLLELGQPLHAFDYDLIEGRKIVVRDAEKGETIRTLDGTERVLTEEDLLICDADRAIALAGVMGGGNTEVSGNTKNILLESAYFNPIRVRRTSKRTGLHSESSYRFERGVDPNSVVKALDRAAELIRELAGGKVSKGRIDAYPSPVKPQEVGLALKRLSSILGTKIETEKIKRIMEGLEIEPIDEADGVMTFRIPAFRVDLTREIDLIEEVARHYGYGNITATLPSVRMKADIKRGEKNPEEKVKDLLASFGFFEAINYSFEDPEYLSLFDGVETIRILNPLSKEGSAMRTSLIPGIMRNVGLNLNHQIQDIRIFEIGKVYVPSENGLPKEIRKIAGAATGGGQLELWEKEEFSFFHLKGVIERMLEAFSVFHRARFEQTGDIRFLHPGKSAKVVVGNEETGFAGELHPDFQEKLGITKPVYLFEVDLEKLSAPENYMKKKFTPLPKFPSVRRDMALIVDENLPVGEILSEVRKTESDLIEETGVFDVFKGGTLQQGKKSVAVYMILRAQDRTLTDEETNMVQTNIVERLQSALGAELRK